MATKELGEHERICAVVSRIPPGRVATYGQIATLAGLPGRARQVGYALAALGDRANDVPWFRVINAKGEVSPRKAPGGDEVQRQILESEGVAFNQHGRVSFEQHRWKPRASGKRGGGGA